MLVFLLKSGACMGILLLFYKLLLEREDMHVFKRFYLLVALVISLVIPNIIFIEYIEPVITTSSNSGFNNESAPLINSPQPSDLDVINWGLIAWTIYFLGLAGFGFRFLKNLVQILNRIRKSPKLKEQFSIKILLQKQLPPHTFFKYIFLNKNKFETNEIPKEVLLHEEVHARQRHSIDVIFVEFLQVILWFNPFVYFYKKSIKLNHEFLADSGVLKKSISTSKYQNTLLSYLSPESAEKYQSITMANAINYSSIKKRFKIMKTETSKKAVLLRICLVLPLFTLLLYGFSESKLIEKQNTTELIQLNKTLIKKQFILLIDNSQIFLNGKKVSLNSFAREVDILTKSWEETDYTSIISQANFSRTPISFLKKVEKEFQRTHFSKANEGMTIFPEGYEKKIPQEGASRKLISEYNILAKKYNEMDRSNMRIQKKDVGRMEYIYGLMSDKQKADAEPFPNLPEPPPIPEPPAPHLNETHKELQKESKQLQKESNKLQKEAKKLQEEANQLNNTPIPPPPPKPLAPLDHVIEMAKKDATFYLEGKEISSDKAIELLKKNKSLNISTTRTNSKNSQVKISKKPIKYGTLNKKKGLLYYAKELRNKKAQFYYNDEHISAEEGVVYIAAKEYDYVETLPWINKTPEVKIYSK